MLGWHPPSVLACLRLFPDNHYLSVPFPTTVLYNWKSQNSPFSTSPEALTSLIGSIFFNPLPIWDDCQEILHSLFTTKEREWILMKETKALPGLASVVDGQRAEVIDCALQRRPQWDYSTQRGKRSLCDYHKVHLEEMKQAF